MYSTNASSLPALRSAPSRAAEAASPPAPYGKAWKSPSSLNGPLTKLPDERQFTFSSSQPSPGADVFAAQVPLKTPSPTATRAVSPCGSAASHAFSGSSDPSRVTAAMGRLAATGNGTPPPPPPQPQPQPQQGGATDPGRPGLARSNAAATKGERLAAIEAYLNRNAAGYVAEPQRNGHVRMAVEDIGRVYPALSSILLSVNRYVKVLGAAQQNAEATHVEALARQEAQLFAKFEGFFEEKMCAILRDKKKLERVSHQLHQENQRLRSERDGELKEVKVDLMRRLNECEGREDEFRSFRRLIAAVFKTNQQLSTRVEELELLLSKHRITVPVTEEDIFRYSSSRGPGEDEVGASASGQQRPRSSGGGDGSSSRGTGGDGVSANSDAARHRRREEALGKVSVMPPAFMEASKDELNMARLTLQQELLHCAFDDRSAYRLQVSGLRNENVDLKFQASTLATTVEQLNRYIYEKRFLTPSIAEDGSVVRPMTPRPYDVPFGVETELGVNLKGSTSAIVSELSAVAMNLKHQLNSALLRLRQATTVSEWMGEKTLIEIDTERNGGAGVLPTFPVRAWPTIPHFLRTEVSPDVDNLQWTQSDAGAILLTFFTRYAELREECRYLRDRKMVAPRVYEQFERREVVLTRLDATKEEVTVSVENVPFGYVASHFVRSILMRLGPDAQESRLALPGTLRPRFTAREEERPVELEFTRFAYSIWWACQRFRATQPLCRLFLDIVNGRIAVGVFAVTEAVVATATRFVREKLDGDGSRTFAFQRLAAGVSRLVGDMDVHAARCGVLAVAQTFEANEIPVMGGRVRYDALVADESHCLVEARLGADDASAAAHARGTAGNLPACITAHRVPVWQAQPLGASVFVRYWRRLVMERYEAVYAFVERAMAPLVAESEVVLGLYLLPVPEAMHRADRYDGDGKARAGDFAAEQALFFPRDATLPSEGTRSGHASLTRPTGSAGSSSMAGTSILVPGGGSEDDTSSHSGRGSEYLEAFSNATRGVPEVTKGYMALLKHGQNVVTARHAAEGVLLSQIVCGLLEDLPRLNKSVHFPFSQPVAEQSSRSSSAAPAKRGREPAAAAAGAAAKAPKKPKRAKATARAGGAAVKKACSPDAASKSRPAAKAVEAVPTDMINAADKELVEWYGFCHALRQRALEFSEKIFQAEVLFREQSPLAAGARAGNTWGTPGTNSTSNSNSSTAGDDMPFSPVYGVSETGVTALPDVHIVAVDEFRPSRVRTRDLGVNSPVDRAVTPPLDEASLAS